MRTALSHLLAALTALYCLSCEPAQATTEATTRPAPDRAAAAADGTMMLTPAAISSETVFAYEDILWGFNFLPDGRMIATDKSGKLLLLTDGAAAEVSGVPTVKNVGQGGFLDVLPSRDFATDRLLYFSYSKPDANENANTTIIRARLSADETRLEDIETLYEADPKTDKPYHYGSRLVWGRDGKLYFTIGDRGNRDENPQDVTRDGGKVYRINPDGSIPDDNPFVGQAGAKEAIYSYGHRNPQGMTVHPETGEIWAHEHGPRGGDEINLIEAGKNYGWPEITYGINYNGTQITQETAKDGMEQPLHYWVPSIAPSGMAFVTGDRYPGWAGDLMVGSLKFMYIQHVELDGKDVEGEQVLLRGDGRVRDLRMGPDDYLYASIEGIGIVRLRAD